MMRRLPLTAAIFTATLALFGSGCGYLKARDELNKGVASMRGAKFKDAAEHFKSAMELDPSWDVPRLYLATSYMSQWIPGAESPENQEFAKNAREGFLKVLDAVEGEGEGEETDKRSKLLPEVTVGEVLSLETVDGTQHFTQPPPRFSEATLIKALEEDGIGRPSTYAPILSTIQEREYVKRIERVLRPTDLGMIVNDLLVEHFPDVVDAGFTAHIEGQLDQVADGEGDWVPVVDQFYKPFAENLEKARDLMERVEIADEPSDETCSPDASATNPARRTSPSSS